MIITTVVIALINRLISLGLYPLTDPSEGRYADIGRRIVETGDWITPWIANGVPFWGKPPLSLWMTGSSLQLLGETAFAARLPHFLAGVLVVWIVYGLFKQMSAHKTGVYAIAITTGSVLFYIGSGTVMTDSALALGCALAMRGFWLAVNGPQPNRNRECYLFFIGLAVGLLAKGPVVLVLSLIPIGLWTIYSRNIMTVLTQLPWVRGSLLMLVLTLPWYVAAELKTPGFIEYFIVGEHWQRYLQRDWAGDLYGMGHGRPLGMIWLFALIAMLPWTILIPILAWRTKHAARTALNAQDRSMLVYFALWGLVPLGFFSLSSNVLIAYVLPSIAPLACLIAIWLTRLQADVSVRRTLIVGVLVTAAISIAAVLYINLSSERYKVSTNLLIEQWSQDTQQQIPLYFYSWVPQTAKFYTQGQAGLFDDVHQLSQAIDSGKPMYLALYDTQIRGLPEELLKQLPEPQQFGRYTLFVLPGTRP